MYLCRKVEVDDIVINRIWKDLQLPDGLCGKEKPTSMRGGLLARH